VFEVDTENEQELPVGKYLRTVRESRGLTLDEASRVTRIGKNYLVALEEGNFEKLPNTAYIKGFLRLYAGFLSLSGDEVVQRYERGIPAPQRPKVEPKVERPVFEAMEKAKLGGHGRWVIPLVLLGLVIMAALFLSEEEQKPAPVVPRQEAPRPAPVQAPVLPPRSSATVPGAAPAKVEPLPPLTAGDKQTGIVLRLRFNQDSWLSITIDDSISQRYDLKAGDIIEWKGARSFVLDVGDGGAVEAEFNGRPLKALGEPGKPAHVVLKAQ
jgi:cytoskeleton protein RodZ